MQNILYYYQTLKVGQRHTMDLVMEGILSCSLVSSRGHPPIEIQLQIQYFFSCLFTLLVLTINLVTGSRSTRVCKLHAVLKRSSGEFLFFSKYQIKRACKVFPLTAEIRPQRKSTVIEVWSCQSTRHLTTEKSLLFRG
jgi:hypothetical protein